jgi:short-subunit dehydrogenase
MWSGRRALVTGASSGIGAALAKQLAEQRAVLLLTGRDSGALEACAGGCRAAGAKVTTVAGDLTDPAVVARLGEGAAALKGLDLLVHNAGVTMNALFTELELPVLRRVMEVNFFAAVALTKEVLPQLVAAKGEITVISSLIGLVGVPTRTAYAASKHALHGFFSSLRVELRQAGVGVTLVCPGYVDTPMRSRALKGDGTPQGFDQAAGRPMLTAAEVARAALEAAAKRKRLVLLGRETYLVRVLSFLAPGLLERFLARATR